MVVETPRRALINTIAFLSGTAIQKIIGLVQLRILAVGMEKIQPGLFGEWNLVFVYLGFAGAASGLQLDVTLIRELNRSRYNGPALLGSAILLRSAASFLIFIVLAAISFFLPYSLTFRHALLLASFSLFFSIGNLFRDVCYARMDSLRVMACSAASSLIVLTMFLWMTAHKVGLLPFVLAQAFGSLPFDLILILIALRYIHPQIQPDIDCIRFLFHECIFPATAAIFGFIAYRYDVLLLSLTRSMEETGVYAAMFRLSEAFSFIPGALINSLYPLLSQQAEGQSNRMKYTFGVLERYILIIALPVLIILTVCASDVIQLIYGSLYMDGRIALCWLGAAEFLMFLSPLPYHMLLAKRQNREFLLAAVIMASVNIFLNSLLIPSYGFVSAAFATFITELCALITGCYFLWKNEGISFPPRIIQLWLMAGGTAACLYMIPNLSPWLRILAAPSLYGFILFYGRGISQRDIRLLVKTLHIDAP
jgi:O-antigen/teichoic acid export membrane protein